MTTNPTNQFWLTDFFFFLVHNFHTAGPKGRWSTKLTASEVTRLGEKEELDERLAMLLSAARHWFEEPEELEARVDAGE